MKLKKNRNPAVPGFKASGLSCGIKAKKIKDLALIVSDVPATVAGVFTKNRVVSPAVTWSRRALEKSDKCRAIIVNSGNANAVVGPKGMKDCDAITKKISEELSIPQKEVLIASTGVIGVPLPSDKILKAAPELVKKLRRTAKNWVDAAEAIMTTDLVLKSDRIQYTFQGKRISLGGITKGSGMIHPNMATMLAFITTDADVDQNFLQHATKTAADLSFNMISIDGDQSTNDTVVILANGASGTSQISDSSTGSDLLREAVGYISTELAKELVRDGEGAQRLIEVTVEGAETLAEARVSAREIASSLLVKAMVHGRDPNWGRLVMALGKSGISLIEKKVDVFINEIHIVHEGGAIPYYKEAVVSAMSGNEIPFRISLNVGEHSATAWGCDLTEEYVIFNSAYST